MKSNKWTYELYNEEHWSCNEEFDTREEAIEAGREAAKEDEDIDSFYVGKIVDFIPHIEPYRIVDNLMEDACEECGELADSYLDIVTKEQYQKLGELLDEAFHIWANVTNNHPNFYMLRNVVTVEVK